MTAGRVAVGLTSVYLIAFAANCLAEVSIESRPSPLEVTAADYQARVDADGCLSSLIVGGEQFLDPSVSISRGSYFFRGGALKLPKIAQPEQDVIVAKGSEVAVEYRFADDQMSWVLNNSSDTQLVFFLVFASEVSAVRNTSGEIVAASINEQTDRLTCFRGCSALKIEGLTKVWGPWQGPHQVGQVDLEPGEQKQLDFSLAKTSPEERDQIVSLQSVPPEAELTVLSPRPWQVFQRHSIDEGTILVSGRCQQAVETIEVRVLGESRSGPLPATWQSIGVVGGLHEFSARLGLPAGGWYQLEVQAKHEGQVVASELVEPFGVGEVFVGAGQSNSTNCGEIKTQQNSGMVASFSGEHWQLADDPQPGAADRSQGGSFWPAFGDALYEKYQVPIGVAVTGFGGTSVNQWQPDGTLFPWMMTRIHQLGPGGFRALLWHQGESDVEMDADEYYAKLRNVIVLSRAKAGWEFPWYVAQASYHNPDKLRFENVRSAQQRLWDDGIALAGPDTDVLTGDHRDLAGLGIHFSPKGLKAHGQMWAQLVTPYLDEVFQKTE